MLARTSIGVLFVSNIKEEFPVKRFTLFLIILILATACSGKPKIKFDSLTHDFGVINKDSTLTHIFNFTNIGKGILVIKKVTAG
jgi:hypothetical protein